MEPTATTTSPPGSIGNDPRRGVVDGNLAAVALATDDLPAAECHARAALHVKERHLGPDHPELAVTLMTLGTILRRLGDNREAALVHRRALAVLRPSVDPRHPLLRTIDDNLETANVTRQRLKETPR